MQKLTSAYVKEKLYKLGFYLLEDTYVNQRTSMKCKCFNGHVFYRSWSVFRQDQTCRECNLLTKRKEKLYTISKAFNLRGYKLLSTEYINCKIKLDYICPEGHTGKVSWNNFSKGQICPTCSTISRRGNKSRLWKGGVCELELPLFETYENRLRKYQKVHKIVRDELEVLGVECHYCSCIFVPRYTQVNNRLRAINTALIGESNFYCSDRCKQLCTSYGFNSTYIDPESKLYKPKSEKQQARRCQTDHLKQLQIDEVGYNYCEKCGEEVNTVELHHTLEVAKFGLESINSAGHLLVCGKCHKEFTKECRS